MIQHWIYPPQSLALVDQLQNQLTGSSGPFCDFLMDSLGPQNHKNQHLASSPLIFPSSSLNKHPEVFGWKILQKFPVPKNNNIWDVIPYFSHIQPLFLAGRLENPPIFFEISMGKSSILRDFPARHVW